MVLGSDSSVFIFLVPFRKKNKGKKICILFIVWHSMFIDLNSLMYIFLHNFLLCILKARLHNINDKQAV